MRERNSNIELLRLVSILLIISFHYAYKGGFCFTSFSFNELIIKIFWMFGELGVNLFVLITGYFMINGSFKGRKLMLLLMEVMFYHLFTIFIAYKLGIYWLPTNLRGWIMIFLPITLNNYWFITAYIVIYILSSFLNRFILSLSQKECIKLLSLLLLLYSVIPSFVGVLFNDTETLLYYTRLLWLIVIYFVGAYVRLYPIKFLKNKKSSIVASICTFAMLILSILIIEKFEEFFLLFGTVETAYFWRPNTVLMFLLSVFVFHMFVNMDLPQNKIINRLSSTTLGIYILHDGVLSYYLWTTIFKNASYQNSSFLFLHIIMTTGIIFVCGALIDLIRQWGEKYIIKRFLESKTMYSLEEALKILFKKIYIKIESL